MLAEGATVGRYRIEQKLGEGGTGVVYRAVHEVIGRRAAIKVLHPELAAHRSMVTRFLTEGRAANLVGPAGLVEVYEVGSLDDGRPFIVMELLEGEPLAVGLRRGERRLREMLRIGRDLALALD